MTYREKFTTYYVILTHLDPVMPYGFMYLYQQ